MSLSKPFTDADFPVSIIHSYRINRKYRIIYVSAICAFTLIILSLPFIQIPVSVRGTGTLASETERYGLIIPVTGKVLKVFVRENQKVRKGDTILLMDMSLAMQQSRSLKERIVELSKLTADLKSLIQYSNGPMSANILPSLQTGQYSASLMQFIEECSAKVTVSGNREKTFRRYNSLYMNKVVTLQEFEKFKLEYQESISEHQYVIRQYRLNWQSDLLKYRQELRQSKDKWAELDSREALYTIISPCSGSVQEMKPLQTGDYAFANQKIANISPDGRLNAYCYVRPADIGQVRPGQFVSFQIDAFNYVKWGSLTGKVSDISDDIFVVNNESMFKVKCILDQEYFELSHNKTYLKKGTNFIARFTTGEYNLLQLLWRRTDDLIEMNTAEIE